GTSVHPFQLISGGVRVQVPQTWSGNVTIQANGTGAQSNTVFHEISFGWMGRKWPGSSLSWRLHVNGAPGRTFQETFDQLAAGYNAWMCASGVTVGYDGTTSIAQPALDGVNTR